MVLELARCEFVVARENVIALGNSGTGKTHIALALGLAACQRGFSVAFITAASLASQLMEARDERRLLRLQQTLAGVQLLIVDELGYVPLSRIPSGSTAEILVSGIRRVSDNYAYDQSYDQFSGFASRGDPGRRTPSLERVGKVADRYRELSGASNGIGDRAPTWDFHRTALHLAQAGA
jgi:hypothetical protein